MKKWWLGLILVLLPLGQTPTPKVIREKVDRGELPTRLIIPKLGIDAKVEQVGEDAAGRMSVPKIATNTGWWMYGARVGETGSMVIDGHIDLPGGKPGIFSRIDILERGDDVVIVTESGKPVWYKVEGNSTFEEVDFPLEFVFGRNDKVRLNLITCFGKWNYEERNYNQRKVVFAVAE